MSIRIVRLGSPRAEGEGTRIGTVRRPPRGMPKTQFTSGNWHDVWCTTLATAWRTRPLVAAALICCLSALCSTARVPMTDVALGNDAVVQVLNRFAEIAEKENFDLSRFPKP